MKTNKKNIISMPDMLIYFFLFFILLYLNYCYPMTGDDLYFSTIKTNNLFEFILYFGNGRFLGNLGIVILSKYEYIKIIYKALLIFMIIIGIKKLTNSNNNLSLFIIIILMLFPENRMIAEIYSFTSGFQNYFPPIVFTIFILLFLKHVSENKFKFFKITFIFFLGFSCQLFSENSSVVFCILSSILLIYSFIKREKKYLCLSYCISTYTGILCMLILPKILNVSQKMDGYRKVSNFNIFSILKTLLYNSAIILDSMTRCFLLWTILSISLLLLSKKQKNIIFKIILIVMPIYSFINFIYINEHFLTSSIRIVTNGILFISYIFVCIYLICKYITNKSLKYQILAEILLALFSFIPLLFVSPIGPRTIYISYILLVIATINIFNNINICNLNNVNLFSLCIKGTLIFVIVYSLFIFTDIHNNYIIRENYILKSMKSGQTNITIPYLDHEKYLHSDGQLYSLKEKYYYEAAGDINFSLVDWDTWNSNYKER